MSFGVAFALPARIQTLNAGASPFGQLGPTLDLVFAGIPTDPLNTLVGTLDLFFTRPLYEIAEAYSVWEIPVGMVAKTFSQIITFTRASSATYFDAAGVLQTAATNVPRLDYDPSTLAARGFLIEESRTNSIRNNTMQGAVAGTPGTLPTNWQIAGSGEGTLSRDIVGSGVASGVAYIDIRYYGTTSTTGLTIACEPNAGGPAASAGQTWTGSAYVAIVGGSVSNLNAIRAVVLVGRASGGASTSDSVNSGDQRSALTATMQRFSASITLADATTAALQPGTSLAFASGVAIDITLRIGLPQLEQGAFATSVIPTTTTAVTRAADVASVNTLSPWYNAAAGTLYAEAQIAAGVGSTPAAFASLDDTTAANRIQIRRASPGNFANFRIVSSAGSIDVTLASGTLTGVNKTAAAFTASNQSAVNNGTLFTGITPIASMPTVTRLLLGDGVGSLPINGWLRRVSYYPRRLSDAELQSITT